MRWIACRLADARDDADAPPEAITRSTPFLNGYHLRDPIGCMLVTVVNGRIGIQTISALIVVASLGGGAGANPLNVDNGVTGGGHVDVDVDDFGAYGYWLGPNSNDRFQPVGTTEKEATYMAGVYLFMTTPDARRSSVLLTDQQKWIDIIEPPVNQGDGIVGDHVLTRTVTSANTRVAANEVQSTFAIRETNNGPLQLTFALRQVLTATGAGTSRLAQTYQITNTGTIGTALVFHAHWDLDLYWSSNSYADDIVGTGAGHCYVYTRDVGTAVNQSAAMRDGGSTVPMSNYYAGKSGVRPGGVDPAFTSTVQSPQNVWINGQMPTTWRNFVANVGYDTVGESGTTPGADAVMGMEYRFPLAVGDSAVITIERHYGTTTLACAAPAVCGNSIVEAGEQCDSAGVDTIACNGATCQVSACGDGYTNAATTEQCDSGGGDTSTCNGSTCLTSTCGDGYTNIAATEQCDSSGTDTAACNAATCRTAACGDGYPNPAANEQCDSSGVDTAACNGTTCLSSACGDGYLNPAASEQCESSGTDTATCNGTTCQLPACGDGYLNAAAAEDCDSSGADTAACNGTTCRAALCGDGYLNTAAEEQCDSVGVDTATCNGTSCDVARCGDGYPNTAAGEQCDSAGVDTADCNLDCSPPRCGDDYINVAAGEQCETGDPLCEDTSCTFAYSVGGGCAGCSGGGGLGDALPLSILATAFAFRRRRREPA